jgi:hypothetical protein
MTIERVRKQLKGKQLQESIAQKSAQECENTGVDTIEGGTFAGSARKREKLGEMDSPVVVVERGNLDVQDCGAGQDCGDLMAKITTQVSR